MKTKDLDDEDWMLDEEPVLSTAARRFNSGECSSLITTLSLPVKTVADEI